MLLIKGHRSWNNLRQYSFWLSFFWQNNPYRSANTSTSTCSSWMYRRLSPKFGLAPFFIRDHRKLSPLPLWWRPRKTCSPSSGRISALSCFSDQPRAGAIREGKHLNSDMISCQSRREVVGPFATQFDSKGLYYTGRRGVVDVFVDVRVSPFSWAGAAEIKIRKT